MDLSTIAIIISIFGLLLNLIAFKYKMNESEKTELKTNLDSLQNEIDKLKTNIQLLDTNLAVLKEKLNNELILLQKVENKLEEIMKEMK